MYTKRRRDLIWTGQIREQHGFQKQPVSRIEVNAVLECMSYTIHSNKIHAQSRARVLMDRSQSNLTLVNP